MPDRPAPARIVRHPALAGSRAWPRNSIFRFRN